MPCRPSASLSLHASFHLLAPHVRVQAAGGGRSGESDSGRGHRDARQQFERKRGARAPQENSRDAAVPDHAPRWNRQAGDRIQHPVELLFQLPLEITHL